jgi:hypothetical protein
VAASRPGPLSGGFGRFHLRCIQGLNAFMSSPWDCDLSQSKPRYGRRKLARSSRNGQEHLLTPQGLLMCILARQFQKQAEQFFVKNLAQANASRKTLFNNPERTFFNSRYGKELELSLPRGHYSKFVVVFGSKRANRVSTGIQPECLSDRALNPSY